MRSSKKLKILFDAGPLVNGSKSGIGYYTYGLIENLAKNYPSDITLVGHYFDFLHRKNGIDLPQAPNIRYRKSVFIPGKLMNALRRLGIPIPFELLIKERGDAHVFPGFIGWGSIFHTPSAPVIHDVTYLIYPDYVSRTAQQDLEKLVPATIARSSLIITNSHATKQDILEHYSLDNKPIVVGHIPPVNNSQLGSHTDATELKNLNITGEYILFLGNIEPRKNLKRLVKAYANLSNELKNKYSLVLAGGKGWNNEEILNEIINLQQSGDKIILTGYVTDKQREALYFNATLFVLPSIYEGFGMPILDAMAHKTPLLVSDIPAHREVADDAAIYCSPTNTISIETGLTRLLNDQKLRKELVKLGEHRLAAFSWDKVSQDIFEAIKGVVK